MKKKIAIQGIEGSFHHMAVAQYWGAETEILACRTFRELVQQVAKPGTVDGGLMAIENSIAGSILPNYNLLTESGLTVAGELCLAIKQQLLVPPGTGIGAVREVHSHPMAILQCLDFIAGHPWKIVETEDTALSAKMLGEQRPEGVAVIASALAAALYDLDIVAPDIHTQSYNYTRFLLLQQQPCAVRDADKASVCFHVADRKGSLAGVLREIAGQGVNLSKLQSLPIPGSNWLYRFYADMEFDDIAAFYRATERMRPLTEQMTIHGVYKSGKNIS